MSQFDASSFLDDEQVWRQVLSPTTGDASPAPALFLDRDGVVVEEVHYLHRAEDCRLIDGAAKVIRETNERGWFAVIVTNQAGIARGLYGWREFRAVQEKMFSDLSSLGARIDAVYACPHHEKGTGVLRHPDHPARKPNPGMLLRAAEALPIDIERSWIIGDRTSDIEAGKAAGLKGGLQVLTGHGDRAGEVDAALALASNDFGVQSIPSIAEAPNFIWRDRPGKPDCVRHASPDKALDPQPR